MNTGRTNTGHSFSFIDPKARLLASGWQNIRRMFENPKARLRASGWQNIRRMFENPKARLRAAMTEAD